MKKEELYKIAVKAESETRKDEKYYCPFCFASLIKRGLRKSSYLQDFLRWQEKNNIYTVCGSALLYLEELGVIKILSGVNEYGSVSCQDLDYIIKNIPVGNKI